MIRPPGRFTLGRLMVAIAALAVLLAAWLYRRQNSDVDQATISAALRALTWGDVASRRRAVEDLGEVRTAENARIYSALEASALGDGVPEVRRASVRSLGKILSALGIDRKRQTPPVDETTEADVEPIQVVVRVMVDGSNQVRREAAEAFGHLQTVTKIKPGLASGAVPSLERLLGDLDPGTRLAAVNALGRVAEPPAELRARMIALMERDPDAKVRCAAIEALVRGWPSGELYNVLLTRRNKAPTLEEQLMIAGNLGNLPAPPLDVVPALVALMESDEMAALTVPGALTMLGERGRPWLGSLRKAAERELEDPPSSFRLAYGAPLSAAHALATIDPDSPEAQAMLGPLGRRLRDTCDQTEAWKAAGVLEKYRGSAASAVPTVREMLKSPSIDTRLLAIGLLGKLGPSANPAVEDLEALSRQDPDSTVRRFAERSLQTLRPR